MENILKETFSHLMQNRCFNLYFYNEYFMGGGGVKITISTTSYAEIITGRLMAKQQNSDKLSNRYSFV